MSTWITEAEQHKELSERIIYCTRGIESFVNDDRLYWIVAAKGMGKTLLLRYKRELMEQSRNTASFRRPSKQPSIEHTAASSDGHGILILPHDTPLDYVHLPSSLPVEACKAMTDRTFWRDLWKISIVISIFSNFSFSDSARQELLQQLSKFLSEKWLPPAIRDVFTDCPPGRWRRINPCDALWHFLQMNVGDIAYLRRFHMQMIHRAYVQSIRSGVCVFIDSFDQALRESYASVTDSLKIWIEGQLGLLLAAWEITRHNRHVKVYTSIRQEAYAAFRDESRASIFGSMLMLRYSKEDLQQLFNKSLAYFEDKKSLNELVGVSRIKNESVDIEPDEDVFDFTHRHVIATPRSFMVTGGELAQECGNGTLTVEEREKRFRRVLHRCASDEICQDYLFGEMNLFLTVLKVRRNVDLLFSLIHRNILTETILLRIVREFNSLLKADGVWPGHEVNPFCELYNIGLLGGVSRDPFTGTGSQYFRKPCDFDWEMGCVLPSSPVYFLHPSLHPFIASINPLYRVSRVVIGDERPWKSEFSSILRDELLRIFVSYSTADRNVPETVIESVGRKLTSSGVYVDFWFDKWKIRTGQWIQVAVEDGLKNCDLMLVLISKKSLQSGWVESEWRTQFSGDIESGRVSVLPVLIDDIEHSQLPVLLRGKRSHLVRRHSAKNFEKDINKLSDDILQAASELGKHPISRSVVEY